MNTGEVVNSFNRVFNNFNSFHNFNVLPAVPCTILFFVSFPTASFSDSRFPKRFRESLKNQYHKSLYRESIMLIIKEGRLLKTMPIVDEPDDRAILTLNQAESSWTQTLIVIHNAHESTESSITMPIVFSYYGHSFQQSFNNLAKSLLKTAELSTMEVLTDSLTPSFESYC